MVDGADGWDDMPRLIIEAQAAQAKAKAEAEKSLSTVASSSSSTLASTKAKRKVTSTSIATPKSQKASASAAPKVGSSDSDSDSEISALHELSNEHRLTFISHLENQTLSQLTDLADKIDDKAPSPSKTFKATKGSFVAHLSTSSKFKALLLIMGIPTSVQSSTHRSIDCAIDTALPFPGWTSYIHNFPSGPRTRFFNINNSIVDSIPQTHKHPWSMQRPWSVQHNPPSVPPSTPPPPDTSMEVSPGFLLLQRNLKLPDDPDIRNRADAMLMPANALGPNTEITRQSATISLKNYALSPDLKERSDARIKIEDPATLSDDNHKRLEEWNKLKELLPQSCFFDMVGGRLMYEAAPAQSEIAIRRKAILA
jgi:hypothetical protein